MRPIKLSKKERGLAVLAAALGFLSTRSSDPWVVVPSLLVCWGACVYLAGHHEGRYLGRISFVVLVTAILSLLGFRNLYVKDPKLQVSLSELRLETGNPAGCTVYMVNILPNRMPIDRFYLRVEIPTDLYTFNVNAAQEYPSAAAMLVAISKNSDGECYIKPSQLVDNPAIMTVKTGPNILRITGKDLSAMPYIYGLLIPYIDHRRSFSPSVGLAAEGSYDFSYNDIGRSGKFKVINTGISEGR